MQENVTTTARVPTGALVEREIKMNYWAKDTLTLGPAQPRTSAPLNAWSKPWKRPSERTAPRLWTQARWRSKRQGDLKGKPVELLSKLREVDVDPVTSARVVINERTGTIVAGGDVHLSPVAIAQGGITISIQENQQVVQPNAFGTGRTADGPE